ncbi:MAG TPA: histidine kinase [Acidimicrobiales bacterium]|nr:histidine kinase [Acidimicrobiales bacterium]
MIGEQQRIESDLAEILIQRLFAVGMELHVARKLVSDETALSNIDSALEKLDDLIQLIRRAVLPFDQLGQVLE